MTPRIGSHVSMEWQGRTLLGAIVGTFTVSRINGEFYIWPDLPKTGEASGTYLMIRFFNGDPWPFAVHISMVEVLQRTFVDIEN